MTQPSDASKKSLRTFQCRDQLWETFESMARELECSVDYLVNEAMKQYARQRQGGAGVPRTLPPIPSMTTTPGVPLPVTAAAVPMARAAPPPIPSNSSTGRLPPPPTRPLPPPPPGARVPPPMPSAQATLVRSPLPPPLPTPRQPSSLPPQPPPAYLGGLTAIYNGERTSVSKEKFVIGRGRQASDLTIKDPNVSRQHAMVEFQSGVYYMVDLGSTNGVEYNGQRVTRKAIAEGDVFRICDHDITFTYR